MKANNANNYPHVVIAGGGFAGLNVAKHLKKQKFRVTLIDKNNYHTFAPLLYQVAAAQLAPSSILFSLRKEMNQIPKHRFLMAEIEGIDKDQKVVITNKGNISYDYLVLAMGADSNFYGNENIQNNAFGLKSISESLAIRNHLLDVLEKACSCQNEDERKKLLSIAVVGAGPTGVEMAGAIGELKRYIIPKDYQEINPDEMSIMLIEGQSKILSNMSEKSSKKAKHYFEELGVELVLNTLVKDYDGNKLLLSDGREIETYTVIWASGIKGCDVGGIDKESLARGNRIKVNEYNQLLDYDNIFVVGDACFQTEPDYPNGHPQTAPAAIQQSSLVAKNLINIQRNKPLKSFKYFDKGSMAIIGRNRAVVDFAKLHFGGFMAWLMWLVIHLLSIIGFKNKIVVVIDWAFSYFSGDDSFSLIIKPNKKERD